MTRSLIHPATEQLDLIPSSNMDDDIFREQENSPSSPGEYTGARLWKNHPEKYTLIVSLLAESIGILKIARILRVSPNTVIAVRDREGESIDIEKTRIASAARAGSRIIAESILDDLGDRQKMAKTPIRDKAVTLGILVDKSQLLEGHPTYIVDHTVSDRPDHDSFNIYISGLPAADISETDSERFARLQKGEPSPREDAACPVAGVIGPAEEPNAILDDPESADGDIPSAVPGDDGGSEKREENGGSVDV